MGLPTRERALLLGDDMGVYLAVARSLGRRGIEVHVVPAEFDLPGLSSRYIVGLHPLPRYFDDPDGWANALKALAEREGVRRIIPCSDSWLMLLERHADLLGRERLAIPNAGAFRAFTDKAATRALAASVGVALARGCSADRGAAAIEAELGLPLVVKPASSYRPGDRDTKTYARVVRSRSELESTLAQTEGDWLAEAFFDGEGVGLSMLARDGRILLASQHRRLQTLSETSGSSVRTTEMPDARLLADAQKLAAETKFTGVAMFEFRRNRRTREHILLEVNARFWGSLPLAIAAGADFPALLWDVLNGRDPRPLAPRAGVTRSMLTGEFDRNVEAVENAASRGSQLRALASLALFLPRLLFPAQFDSWAADDPEPFLHERREILARLTHRLARRGQRAASVKPRAT
jgi:predicted ATP-grasp superfamily ATP-dependent carboligase